MKIILEKIKKFLIQTIIKEIDKNIEIKQKKEENIQYFHYPIYRCDSCGRVNEYLYALKHALWFKFTLSQMKEADLIKLFPPNSDIWYQCPCCNVWTFFKLFGYKSREISDT